MKHGCTEALMRSFTPGAAVAAYDDSRLRSRP
jgi:hypothetical protein